MLRCTSYGSLAVVLVALSCLRCGGESDITSKTVPTPEAVNTAAPRTGPATDIAASPADAPHENVAASPADAPHENVAASPADAPHENVAASPADAPHENVAASPARDAPRDVAASPADAPHENVASSPARGDAPREVAASPADAPHAEVGASPVATVASLAAPPDVAAPPANAQRTASGLAYRVLEPGTSRVHPQATSTVQVHYTGWTTNGEMFDSSVQRGQPASFRLDQVIPGWTEGLQLMTVGEKTRFWIPAEQAYNNRPGRPQGMLVFDVRLLSIQAR